MNRTVERLSLKMLTSDRPMVGLADGRWPMAMLTIGDADGDGDADVSCHFRFSKKPNQDNYAMLVVPLDCNHK